MKPAVEIYIRLLGEGVDVWRPVLAEPADKENCFIIKYPVGTNQIPKTEVWEFQPGDCVRCVEKELADEPSDRSVRWFAASKC